MRLLRLYPRAWRERYEAEMLALLEQHDVTILTRIDLLRGALDAWFLRPAAWRGARLGLIPSAFIVAQFLMGATMWFDATLVNAVSMASLLGIFPLCFWAGLREERRGSPWRARVVAGAGAGMAAAIIGTLVHNGLVLLDFGFGITRFLLSLHGGTLYTTDTLATVAGKIFTFQELFSDGFFALVAAALGAATGTLGAAIGALAARLNAIRNAQTSA
jgi:hypothetical protein